MRFGLLLLFSFFEAGLLGQAQSRPNLANINDIGNRDINRGNINFTSAERELAIGRSMAAELERRVRLLDDVVVAEYINRLARNLVLNSDARQVQFTFKVVDSTDVNASSLPGGFVYINRGVIVAADNEAQLASVIAHQIAHVAARHSAEIATKAQLLNFASASATGNDTYHEMTYRESVGSLPWHPFVLFLRKNVAEADYLGVQYLYKSGYDPRAAAEFLKKYTDGTSLARSHPSTARRVEAIQNYIDSDLPRRENNVMTTAEFESIKQRVTDRR
jgi:predicted Zn-dependent protease